MKTWLGALTVCLAVGVPLAGCGGGNDNNDNGGGGASSTKSTEQTTAPSSSGGTSAGGANVTMKDIKFNPGKVTVDKGGTVTWTNDDSVGHDVTGDKFNSGGAGNIEPGKTFAHKFAKAGTYDYVCTVHPGMKGTIKVTK
jgi:plastocyanin